MISYLNDTMIAMLVKLNITHYSIQKSFDKPHHNEVSSLHFFSSDIKDSDGCLNEHAYYIPDMHSNALGKLSGFVQIDRKNGVNTNLISYDTELTNYISSAVILKSKSGASALYINNVLINDDKDLPNINNDTFWDCVKSKYKINKPETVYLSQADENKLRQNVFLNPVLNQYTDYNTYYKTIPLTIL